MSDPLMRRDLIFVLKHLEARADRKGWDRPPDLRVLTLGGLDPWDLFFVADQLGMKGRPPEVLEWFADRVKEDPGALRTALRDLDHPWGWAFVHEGWEVRVRDPKMNQHLLNLARQHQLHDHPDRVEVRLVAGVAVDGSKEMVTRVRGGEPQVYGGTTLEGVVFDSLTKLLTAFR